MTTHGHGGARPGAGRKPSDARKVKRSVALSVATDTAVLAAMQPDESYSQTLERLLQTVIARPQGSAAKRSAVEVLVAALGPEREAVASVYRRLGWARQDFESIVQANRSLLARSGVRLYVAPKVAASGRLEQYITIDGMRYSAISRDQVPTDTLESRL